MPHEAIDRAQRLYEGGDVEAAARLLAELVVVEDSDDGADRHELLGRIATAQQRPADALRHLEQALAIRVQCHGKTSVETARAHGAIARHHLVVGAHEAGLAAAKLAVKRSDGDPGWLVVQADLERNGGDAHAAEQTYAAALKKLRGAARIPALRGLGNVHILQGNGKKAKQRFEQALALVEDDASYDAATLESGLGQAATAIGDADTAALHFERAFELLTAAVGELHPDVSICLVNLGLAATASDNWKAAAATQYAIAIDERAGRTEHPFHATALNNLAYYCSEVGKPRTAIVYAERALAILEKTCPPWHLDVALTLSNLANYHREAGREDLALVRARQLAAIASELEKTAQETAAAILFSTGTLLLQLGKDPAAAFALYTTAVSLRERLREEEDDTVVNSLFNAVAHMFVAGATDRAIALLEGARSRWEDEDNLDLLEETLEAVRAGDREAVLQGTELDESEAEENDDE